ncbi:VCBS repeat-containing protein [Croceivirga radicis]|uniref:VCBS repeat-containing protein n=1 Tax=Croceivirga radicis TaxID=1929488 RepID=UPI000255ABFE|nr:VCBS repeat-containing protein [Croceivirga radicis]
MTNKFICNILLCLSIFSFLILSCKEKEHISEDSESRKTPLYTSLSYDYTGVDFQNKLKEGPNTNVLMYEYFYNGGGVALADINNDGLLDIYFTSNMGENKCYLNLGNMKFKDITIKAGLLGRKGPWKTGISAADVNGDGLIDYYLCYSGALPGHKRVNQLFINQGVGKDGVPRFKERAKEYGLDSEGYSNQGYFLDYDKDGDLDMLLLNHNPKSLPILNVASTKRFLKEDDTNSGLRLFNNDKDYFTDVTLESGINGSPLSYGLAIGIADLNEDGWPDFYVSNDYAVPDYLYINQKDGTFTDQLKEKIGHTSQFSMGNDIADVDDDGLLDIYTLDMLPEDNKRQKLLLAPDNYEKFGLNVKTGFHYQYMRNMLQKNIGNGVFSEIGQLAGISNTDWSWSALWADYSNNGNKELFVTNGYLRDYTNLDYIDYMDSYVASKGRLQREDVLKLVSNMPSSKLQNYFFTKQTDFRYLNTASINGLNEKVNSNGAAYGDLDNDGDLDLVVNNINERAFIYQNNTNSTINNYLDVVLQGSSKNTLAIGATVKIFTGKEQQILYQMPTRGYLSTVSPILHFGLGTETKIDSLILIWNSGEKHNLYNLQSNQRIELKELIHKSNTEQVSKDSIDAMFKWVQNSFSFKDIHNNINDFNRQTLLLKQYSHKTPTLVKSDFNGDGKEDFIVAGGVGNGVYLYLGDGDGQFNMVGNTGLPKALTSNIQAMCSGDFNADGFLDIYLGYGGYHSFKEDDNAMVDQLYLGNGQGKFVKSQESIGAYGSSTNVVVKNDIDKDGDLDLFIGSGVIPGNYPRASESYFLINDGKGNFLRKSLKLQVSQNHIITGANWVDIDRDGKEELALVGEFMPFTVLKIEGSQVINMNEDLGLNNYNGLWNTLSIADLNDDGKADFVLGNLGENTQLRATVKEPIELFYSDFDNNGSVDPILNTYIQGTSYPYLSRKELLNQLSFLKSKYTTYESFSDATIENILTKEQLGQADKKEINTLSSLVLLSTSGGNYKEITLPVEAQKTAIKTIIISDFNKDGFKDLLLFGNEGFLKLSLGKLDAGYGSLLLGDGNGNFNPIGNKSSGLKVTGDVHGALFIDDYLIIGAHGQPLETYKLNY